MNRPRSRAIGLGSAAILLVAMAVPGAAQSPASDAPASPAVTDATAVGPIEWKRVTKGKDFTSNPEVYSVAQLPDGRLVVVGNITGGAGRTGAMWSSADGRKWTRAKIKAPEGSIIFAVAHAGSTIIATGASDDGSLLWTSTDGSAWQPADGPSGAIYSLLATDAGGFVGAGVEGGAAMVWSSPDGTAWRSETLAPSGRALHVAQGLDGSLVVAGVVTDEAGNGAPVIWNSDDGSAWTETALDGLAPGFWSVPAMAQTPAGFVLTLSEPGESGSIGHVWWSADGKAWQETLVDDAGTLSVVGTAGTDALLIGHGQVLRSPDGITWTPSDESTFEGWDVRDLMTLNDGRFFADGDAFSGMGSSMAVWIGEADPVS
jgi:hypothetical protein